MIAQLSGLPASLPSPEDIKAEIRRRELIRFTADSARNYRAGWVHIDVADRLQKFSEQVAAGLSPRLMLLMPPRHGKSMLASERFPAWHLGHHPDHRIIVGSYSSGLSETFSLRALNLVNSQHFSSVFPRVKTAKDSVRQWLTREIDPETGLPPPGFEDGGYMATGVGAGTSGHGAHVFVVDDPVSDPTQANSPAQREKVWEWYRSVVYTRLAPGGGTLLIMTRWHKDDLAGRLLKAAANGDGDQWEVVNYPAIAIEDEKYRKKGEALDPARFPVERLSAIKKNVGEYYWNCLYQQGPVDRDGALIKTERIKLCSAPPAKRVKTIRYWDKASVEGGGKRSAGVKMSLLADKSYLIEHVAKGQFSPKRREMLMQQMAAMDGPGVRVYLEQEPGSGGKESAENSIANLAGFSVSADRPSGDKVTRAEPFSVQVEGGNVYMIKSDEWNQEYLDELGSFPFGEFKDQVDATSGAFNKLSPGGFNRLAMMAQK